ncbi:hypothetical protein F5880DRAFT_1494509 [Lentinula raphanica]|nr:hypothetical protein F5880DRAFT_1494509 [Lentinula raphanica]
MHNRSQNPVHGEQHPEPNDGQLENHPNLRKSTGCAKNTKASIKLAALNIKGNGSTNLDHQHNKWGAIDSMMSRKKISILVVGEAHMDSTRRKEIEDKYTNLRVMYSRLEHTPNAAGIAVVLNKRIANTAGIQVHEIVAGHAMLIEMTYHSNESLSILAVYAPNRDNTANANFWKSIRVFFEHHPRIQKPEFMLGDLNMVEEALDRLPSRLECNSVMDSFDDLKTALQMEDGWRNTFPTRLEFTFSQE